jgi:hypothetical protein
MALTLSGQRFALFKKTPDFFLFAAIHGALPVGPTLRVVQNCSGQFYILKIWSSDDDGPVGCSLLKHGQSVTSVVFVLFD